VAETAKPAKLRLADGYPGVGYEAPRPEDVWIFVVEREEEGFIQVDGEVRCKCVSEVTGEVVGDGRV